MPLRDLANLEERESLKGLKTPAKKETLKTVFIMNREGIVDGLLLVAVVGVSVIGFSLAWGRRPMEKHNLVFHTAEELCEELEQDLATAWERGLITYELAVELNERCREVYVAD